MGIVTAIIVLGVLVFVHELGHFLVAKFFGVGVLEFALGFGPVLARWQGGETSYSLRVIPLGGFVRMAGDDPVMVYGESVVGARPEASGASPIEGTQEELTPQQQKLLRDESRWFLKKSYLPRCAIVLAGPVANFLFAWVLAFASYWMVGLPTIVDGPVTIGGIQKGLPAAVAGLQSGDKVVSVDGKPVYSFTELVSIVRNSGGKTLQIAIQRRQAKEPGAQAEGATAEAAAPMQELVIPVKPLSDASPELDVLEGRDINQTYRIGITPGMDNVTYAPVDLQGAAVAGAEQVVALSMQTLRVLKGLLTGLLSPTKTIGGPIEIIKQTAASANEGWMAVVGIMIFLNVTLGIMNLLPIPVLDGGHLTLFTVEQLRGRPLSMKLQAAVTNVGLVILLSLMVFAVGNDLVRALL
jgi:regulator of sigma E protease